MIRHSLTLLAAVAILSYLPGSAAVQTADEVVEKHLAAIGGRAALAKLTTRRAMGKVTITTPNGDISGPIEISGKAPNKTRAVMNLDMSALGLTDTMTLEQKFDGIAGWMLNSLQGDSPITGNQLENMRNGSFPSPLLTYKAAGSTLALLPRETVAGKEYLVLKLTPKAGSVVTMYFDPESYQLMRSTATVKSPELGDLEQVNEVSDYRDVGGIKVPFVVVNSNNLQRVTIRLDKVEHNVPMDDAIFAVKMPRP